MPKDTFFNLPEDKRQAIIELAIDEFAEHDYRNTSISRIVARAGIAKGSFYQYFNDKQDLYLYLIELVGKEKIAFLSQVPLDPAQMGLFDYLRGLFKAGLGFQFANPRLAQIAYRAVYSEAPLPDEVGALVKRSAAAYFRPLVIAAMQRGEMDPELDPELVAFLFNALLTHLGDFILERVSVSPEKLAAEGGGALDRPEVTRILEQVLRIMERGTAR